MKMIEIDKSELKAELLRHEKVMRHVDYELGLAPDTISKYLSVGRFPLYIAKAIKLRYGVDLEEYPPEPEDTGEEEQAEEKQAAEEQTEKTNGFIPEKRLYQIIYSATLHALEQFDVRRKARGE